MQTHVTLLVGIEHLQFCTPPVTKSIFPIDDSETRRDNDEAHVYRTDLEIGIERGMSLQLVKEEKKPFIDFETREADERIP